MSKIGMVVIGSCGFLFSILSIILILVLAPNFLSQPLRVVPVITVIFLLSGTILFPYGVIDLLKEIKTDNAKKPLN